MTYKALLKYYKCPYLVFSHLFCNFAHKSVFCAVYA